MAARAGAAWGEAAPRAREEPLMGLLPEIEHGYLVLNRQLILWNYSNYAAGGAGQDRILALEAMRVRKATVRLHKHEPAILIVA